MYPNFHTFTPNMTTASRNPQETRFSSSQLQRFRLSASSQGESRRCSVCRKPAILDYVYAAPIPGLGAPLWKFSGVEGCAWTAQVAIKRSRSIEANTLTSTYQSPCLAIKQLQPSRKNTSLFHPPSSRYGCWWSSVRRRQGTTTCCEMIFISPQPPKGEQGGVGADQTARLWVRRVLSRYLSGTWGTSGFQPRV